MTEEIIAKYLSRQCTLEELKILVEWAEQSPENAKRLFDLEQTACTAHQNMQPDPDHATQQAWDTLQSRIARSAEPTILHAHPRRKRIAAWIWSAASVIVLAAIGAWMFIGKESVQMVRIATADTTMLITLPDSSTVWLNRNTLLEYPETFAAKSREVSLQGEAYFSVSKDPLKPFIIDGRQMQVEVTGTRFNMKSYTGSANEVSLIEGGVRVRPTGSKDGVDIRPGQKLTLDAATGTITVTELRTDLDAVWTNNVIPFRHANIRSIAEALEYLYGVTVHISNDVDCKRTYSGGIRHDESIDTLLDDITRAIPVRYTVKGTDIYLSRK